MKLKYKIFVTVLLAAFATTSCNKYLDVNSDNSNPQDPDVSSVFPTQLGNIPRGLQYDARYVSRFIQNFGSASSGSTTAINWDKMGFQSASDVNGDIWRMTYYGLGANLNYIITKGIANGQWDYVGAAYALKAMSFQYTTDYHGDIIFKEAFPADENQVFFKYDNQETVYAGVDSLCRMALTYLSRTDYNPSVSRLSKGDYAYDGNVDRWKKFVYGLLARNFHRITNKASYQADSVIKYCDLSLASAQDDFGIPFDAQKNDDANFFGIFRDNLTLFRQTNYIVSLLDGTTLTGTTGGANIDPRMKHMLSRSADSSGTNNGGYKGVVVGVGDPQYSSLGTNRKAVPTPFGDSIYVITAGNFSGSQGKYLFANKVVMPIMTSAEIQFMKAEALFRKSDKPKALLAYQAGIRLHFDFINRTSWPRGNTPLFNVTAISPAERDAYMASANVKQIADSLTLSDIMLQKYIALYGWGFFETWVDMRRYHYTDLDPNKIEQGIQVYKNLVLPTFAAENAGRPVYRVRPRYNSEYIWNVEELRKIGAMNGNYHTYECWFSQP
ncbi:SusD/RagB family nutrient-binding outer membrane lipoprotein [Filimonas effusa]|uniref:SusD/RagB family nutrient-binding outer membrane lipoprotein n=1 Tax=Filimonas effusa TaxID=2508721 RepID=A0A4Q1DAI9_9BACT|nr:SusD/RagB family nutrient-binding outer membrane lipoprotein [Filimonas effusa]RXK86411.1 SusD/RagB family nutrient-binding outer membrane lipoprotein [Filimonas effusa]